MNSQTVGKRFTLGLALSALLLVTGAAEAGTHTWTGSGGSGDWGATGNWDAAPIFGNAADLVFTGAVQPATFLGAARTIKSLTFDANADTPISIRLASTAGGGTAQDLTLGGGVAPSITIDADSSAAHTLGVSDGKIILAGDLTVTHNGAANFTINRPLTGAFGLTKAGTGTLTLLGGNTYSGATAIDGGTLVLNNANGNRYNGGNILINNGSTLRLTPGGGDQFWFTSKTFIFDSQGGGILDAPGINFVMENSTVVTSGGAQNILSRSNGGGFGFNLNGTTATFNVARGNHATSDLLVTTLIVNSGSVVKTGSGILSLNSINTYRGATAVNDGTLMIGGAGQLNEGSYGYALSLANAARFVYASSAAQTMSGAISGNGSLTVDGSGALTLSAANTYSGATTVSNGTLIVAAGGTIIGSASVTVAAGAQMTIANTGNVIADLAIVTLDGTMALGAGVNETVGGLSFGGVYQSPGTWGSSSSAAMHKDDTHFAVGSTGMLTVAQPQALVTTFSFPGYLTTISTTNITCMVPAKTSVAALAPTYTLSPGATCDRASGSAQDFTTPLTYTVVSSDEAVTNVYRVTVNVVQTPVINGLALWLDASQLTGLADGAQVDTWTDMSGLANNALRQVGTPKYVANGVNGLPVVRFNVAANTGDYFKFSRISTIRTVFWVLKGNSVDAARGFLLGDEDQYHFHRGAANNYIWDGASASVYVRQGTTKLMGSVVDGTATPLLPGEFKLLSLVTTGNVQANQITKDRNQANRYWYGDIAEILIFNRALSRTEENSVGAYLAAKYALTTGYDLTPQAVMKTFGGNGIASEITGSNIACDVPYGTDVTAVAPTYVISPGATCDKPSGAVQDFTTPQTYTVVSSDLLTTNVYQVTFSVSQLPVINGLALWLDASKLKGLSDGDSVDMWPDASGWANNAVKKTGAPKYVASGINGLPAVRLNQPTKTGEYFQFPRISTIRTVFWVVKESAAAGQCFLLGDDTVYHFHRDGSKNIWDNGSASTFIKAGTTKLMGSQVYGTTTQLPADVATLVSLVTTDNVFANQITLDRNIAARSWCGDIAEILIYNRALTSVEENGVGAYLAAKYALTTGYDLTPQAVMKSFGGRSMASVITGTDITCTVPFGSDVTALAPTYVTSPGATCDKASGSTRNFSTPVTYAVTSSDSLTTTVYTVTVIVAPDAPAVVNVNYGNAQVNLTGSYSFDVETRGSASQVAPALYGGNTWNDFAVAGINSTNLKDSKGVSTGIGLTTAAQDGISNQSWADGNARVQWDGLRSGNTSYAPMLTLSGLTPGHNYDIYVVSAVRGNAYFRIGTEAKHHVAAAAADWVEDKNYVLFKRHKPNVDGTLVMEAMAGTGVRFDVMLNGFQLVDRGPDSGTIIMIR